MSGIAQQVMLMDQSPAAATLFFGGSNGPTVPSPISTPTVSAPAINTGPTDPSRVVYAMVLWNNGNSANTDVNRPMLSCTIGGQPATIIEQVQGDIGAYWAGVAIVACAVPAGSSVVVTPTFQSGAPYYQIWVGLCSVIGLANGLSPLGTDNDYQISGSSLTENVPVLGGGVTLSTAFIFWNTTSVMTGLTRNFNTATSSWDVQGGSIVNVASNASYPVTISVSGSSNFLMATASFR